MANKNIKILYDKIKEIKKQPYRYIPYKEQMNMKEWDLFRLYVIISNGAKCEMCGFSIVKYLNIYYKEYNKNIMLWQYSLDEVMCLCKHCIKKVNMPKIREKYNKTKHIKDIRNGSTKKR